jgi:uncharacterized protein YceK
LTARRGAACNPAGGPVRRLLRLWLTAGAVGLAGCGTFLNMQEEPFRPFWPEDGTPTRRVYGGVVYDAAFGADMLADSFRPGSDFFGPLGLNWGWSVLTVDLPLSAVGDTLTLPWTVPASLRRALAADATSARGPLPAEAGRPAAASPGP